MTNDKPVESKELIRQILPLMSRHTDDFRPKSYALWYEYATGSNAELKRELDERIRSGARLTGEVTFELYNRHLIENAENDISKAQDELLKLLSHTQQQMNAADSETTRFSDSLVEFGVNLNDPARRDQIKEDVAGMIDETSRIGEAITGLLAEVRDSQSEVARLSLELVKARDQANTDALTGLTNRGAFDSALRELTELQGSTSLSMIMLDIDHFKKVNDTYGHPFGDAVIRSVAAAIRALVRGRDVAARYGGEEFAVLLPETDEKGARVLAERIREQIARSRIRNEDGEQVGSITISAGVAQREGRETAESFLGRADRALYRAKTAGRNRVVESSTY